MRVLCPVVQAFVLPVHASCERFRRHGLPNPGRAWAQSETAVMPAHRLADGTAWFVHSTPLVLGDARNELDRSIRRLYETTR